MTQEQLQKFKEILQQRLQKVEDDIQTLLNELEEIGTFENVDDITDLVELREINDSDKALLQKLFDEKKAIQKALKKIEAGTYGKCENGEEIAIEKLEADPLYEC